MPGSEEGAGFSLRSVVRNPLFFLVPPDLLASVCSSCCLDLCRGRSQP